MKRRTICLICAALAFVSCGKDKKVEDRGLRNDAIYFAPKEAETTKAMMDDDDLKTQGNKLRVFDVLTGFTGQVSWMGENNPYYINDEIVYNGNPVWDYVSGRKYPWTTDGSHLFYGWLSYDTTLGMTDAQFFGNSYSYDEASQVLSIPVKEMNASTTQFDFMYSDVYYADAADHVAGQSVNLELKHLFTALNLTVKNTSGNVVYLKRVTLSGMKNRRSAEIAFTQHTPTVTTDNLASTDVVLFESEDEDGDVFENSSLEKALTDFLMMWPHTYNELVGGTLVVEYKFLINDQLSDLLTANIILSNQNLFLVDSSTKLGMDAGKKYTFQLQFKKSTIDIYAYVSPWDYEEFDWEYSKHSIAARGGAGLKDGVLVFYHGTGPEAVGPTADEWSAKTMRFATRNEVITGRFYVESPTEGRWKIATSPQSAAQYFIVTPTSGDIDAYTYDGMCEFTVSVNPNLNPSTKQTLYFSVSIFFNGEWHDANSEFNRKNLKLELDAN
ncbi:MAG: fimbrillin family protein [Bacteroidales bacterium]|nr:fimbrillin family protein [Bacteroidales bacterium]